LIKQKRFLPLLGAGCNGALGAASHTLTAAPLRAATARDVLEDDSHHNSTSTAKPLCFGHRTLGADPAHARHVCSAAAIALEEGDEVLCSSLSLRMGGHAHTSSAKAAANFTGYKALCLASVPPAICACSWLPGHRNDASTAFRSVPCRTSTFHGLQTGLSM
jgi:hypothetical protein